MLQMHTTSTLTHTHITSNITWSFPLLPREPLTRIRASWPFSPAHFPPTINTKQTCSLLTADVETYPPLSLTYSYSHHQQEIIVLASKGSKYLRRAAECQLFFTNEAKTFLMRAYLEGWMELQWGF